MEKIRNNWHRVALILILALAGYLSFYGIQKEGLGNTYYSAAVKSMLTSWHNFFFVSFDPGGFVTVDKPALGLWFQAISAWIFGFHGWSLILPEALSTVISVAVIYHLVQRSFGKTAGIAAALVLALTPILIAVSRTNNLDASLVMVLLLAAWALIIAAEKGSFKYLMLAMMLVGLGFNIKMLQAFMVLPAFYLVYAFTASIKMRKRLMHLAAGTIVLLGVAFSWAVAVDLTPADQRPYIGSSQTNSVFELAFGYNGIQRFTGRENGSRAGGPNRGNELQAAADPGSMPNSNTQNVGGPPNGQMPPVDQASEDSKSQGSNRRMNTQAPPDGGNASGGPNGQMGGPGGGGGPGGTGENGQKGVLRVFNQQMSGQISWMLPMALFGILILSMNLFGKGWRNKDSVLRYLLLWAGWLVPMLIFFSAAGFFHRYYLSMLAPAIAALSGIGIVEMYKAYMKRGWKWCLLPIAIISSAGVQWIILSRNAEWSRILIPVVFGISLISSLVLITIRVLNKEHLVKVIKLSATAGLAALLIAPGIWAYTPLMYGSQTTLPVAGPELNRGNGGGGFGRDGGNIPQSPEGSGTSEMVDFLLKNKQGEKYLVAVSSANSASPIILQTGEAVMAVGGFSGSDPILTAEKLEKMVKNGEIRYFLLGGMGPQSQVSNWVKQHGTLVSSDKWSSTSSEAAEKEQNTARQPRDMMGNGAALYDLGIVKK